MKSNFKKILLMIAMVIILIVLLIMINQGNLKGELICLGLTAALYMGTQTKHHPNNKN